MPYPSSDQSPHTSLRFDFGDAEVRFDLGLGATLEDVALKLADPAVHRRGRPLAVFLDLAQPRSTHLPTPVV